MKNFLLLFFISTLVFGAGIPWKQQTDVGQLGRAGSADPVEFFFDVGDGASNPKFSIDKTTKDFVFSKPVTVGATSFTVGDGTAADQSIIADKGAGASNPKIFWSESESRWKNFDGTTERPFGVGGGGADAINILSDSNPNAEDGVLNWTYVGTGALATTSTNSFVYEGDQSFTVDFDVQAETLKSAEIEIKQGLYGQSCQARFFYIGGDDSIDITATVRDGNDAIVSGSQTKVLKAATIWTVIDLGFVCPSEAEIGVDAQLANMYLQIEQTGVGNSTDFRLDQVHLGGLIGLTTAALPDVLSMRGTNAGVVTSENVDWLDGNGTNPATGRFDYNFIAGTFTVTPSCTVAAEDNQGNQQCTVDPVVTDETVLVLRCVTNPNTSVDIAHNVHCAKQGTDAKQSALVYESIPRVHENVNTFNTKIESDKVTVMNENVDWIDGSCVSGGTGLSTCTFVSGVFTEIPNCSVEAQGFGDGSGTIVNISASSINYQTNSAGSATDARALIICTKANGDFKLPEKQLILVNGVSTDLKKGLKINSCIVGLVGGTPSSLNAAQCGPWVTSYGDNGAGDVTINMISGIWTGEPNCTLQVFDVANSLVTSTIMTQTSTALRIRIWDNVTLTDYDFNIQCTEER